MRLSFPNLSLHDMTAPWVHASVPSGCEEFKEHAHFIKRNVVAGMIGLSLIPAALALNDKFSGIDVFVLSLLASPVLLAVLVSRTGKLELGKRATLFFVTIFLSALIGATGALHSPLIILLAILPLEAVLWRCKSPVRLGIALSIIAVVGIWGATSIAAKLPYSTSLVDQFGSMQLLAIPGVAYALLAAVRIQNRFSSNARDLSRESRRVELFSRHSNELITRHGVDGSTLFATPAARELLGVSSKDLLESGLLNRVHIQDRVILLKALSDAVQLDKEQLQHVRVRVSGSEPVLWKQIEIRCRSARSDDGGSTEAICTMRDVSGLKALEEELLQAHAAASELNDAQRHFLATMSHELRTPLNAIIGFSDILDQELFGRLPHQKHREYVSLIQDSGRHLLNVVNDMLDMSRIEAGKYELSVSSFAMREIADATIAMLQPMALKGGVNVACKIGDSLPDISADKRACQQILINLLSNAIKFTPEGGNVVLSAKQFGRSLRIRLKDEGIGIDQDFLSRIGQPFIQADSGHQRKFEGSGIGLSVVKGLVALHGGEFDIKSKEGAGTVVTVILPLASLASKPVPTDHASQLVHLSPGSKPTTKSPPVTPIASKGVRHARVSA
ncbi:MAG: hypothetical protein GKR97_01855 [Rhizobiaceae bacterium]|nr:hypothetical protein [Rhizobiaceae bacterium]